MISTINGSGSCQNAPSVPPRNSEVVPTPTRRWSETDAATLARARRPYAARDPPMGRIIRRCGVESLGFDLPRGGGAEKIEVTARIGLEHVLHVEPAITSHEAVRHPLLVKPAADLFVLHEEIEPAVLHTQSNTVAVPNGSQGAACRGLRRHVQHDGAECGPAHPRVRDPDHVRHTGTAEFLGNR